MASPRSILITNLCTKTRIKTKDEHVIQCFSAYYKHPALIDESSWHLVKNGTQHILVDKDTLHLMKDMICEWGFDATSDTILTLKVTSTVMDKVKRLQQWNERYEYAMKLTKAMKAYFDHTKVIDVLAESVNNINLSDSEQDMKGSS